MIGMSILRTQGQERKRPARRIVLSSLAVSLRYECETTKSDSPKLDVDAGNTHTASITKRVFQNAAEAIIADRRRVKNDVHERLIGIEKELAKMSMLHCSLDDLEMLQTNLIDEMDLLREFDPATGELIESPEYADLEFMLELVLDACDCLYQKQHIESTSCKETGYPIRQKEMLRMREDNPRSTKEKKKQQNVSCLSAIFRKILAEVD